MAFGRLGRFLHLLTRNELKVTTMKMLKTLLAAAVIIGAAAPALAENRCGWIQNPTPGNWSLSDGDGTWVIMSQGAGDEPPGMENIPDISERQYVRTNGNYGYACACMEVDTNWDEGRITEIYSFRQLSLSKCNNDSALSSPE